MDLREQEHELLIDLIDDLRGTGSDDLEFAKQVALACAALCDEARLNSCDPGDLIRRVFELG